MKYDDRTGNKHHAVLLGDDGCTICDIRTPNPNAETIARDLWQMREALAQAIATIEDFLPNIGNCALQDYGRLNRVLIDSARLLDEY